MHDMYVNSDAFWEAYEYETERKVFRAKEKRAEENGILKGKRETIMKFLKKKLNLLSEELIEEINAANNEQLDKISDCIFDINSEEDIIYILHYSVIDD